MLAPKPLLSAKLEITHCPYELYVNGGLVAQDDDGLPARDEHPLNHWLRSGKNEIALHLDESEGDPDRCEARVAILLAEHGAAPGTEPSTLFDLSYPAAAAPGGPAESSSPPGSYDERGHPSSAGPVQVGPVSVHQLPGRYDGYRVVARTFELPVPFPEWAFLHSERQKPLWEHANPDDAVPHYKALLAEYERLRKLLYDRDVNAFLNACEERSREIDLAYYKQPGETRQALERQIKATMDDPKYALGTVATDAGGWWRLTIGSLGTLSALTTGAHASPILRYEMKDGTPFSIVLPLTFRAEQGRYIVTR